MNLTKHFNIQDFAVSDQYPELAMQIEFIEADKLKLYYLCATILEPVYDEFGDVTILSGKRSPELNRAVNGADDSDHLYRFVSCAVDFTVATAASYSVADWIKTFINSNAWGQLIEYPGRNFNHISLPTPKHHGEILIK